MSQLKPLVGERFKSKSQKYQKVAIHYEGNRLYAIVGIKKVGNCEYIETISASCPLKVARDAMWNYAEVQDGILVK